MDKSLRSHLHLWGFLYNHTCPTPPPNPQTTQFFSSFNFAQGGGKGEQVSFELLRSNDTMLLNILAAIASRTSHLASSISHQGLYLDSCQTLIIGEEGELQVIFKRLHCFIRISRNERKLQILFHCPKDFCPGLQESKVPKNIHVMVK